MEAAYNLYAVEFNDSAFTSSRTFSVIENLNSAGEIDVTDVDDAFYQIQDSLMVLWNDISFAGKQLVFFDLSYSVTGTKVTFAVKGSISAGTVGKGGYCPVAFGDFYTANHAWATGAATNYVSGSWYGKGQGQFYTFPNGIDPASINNTTLPDAATCLKAYGHSNFIGCQTTRGCGYYINVVTTMPFRGANVPSPSNDFVSLGATGVMNDATWTAYTFYNCAPVSLSDPYIDYKNWVNTPMMDFYLTRIPGLIGTKVPAGKSYYDFNVQLAACSCPPQSNPAFPSDCTTFEYLQYYVAYGDFVGTGCDHIGLPYL